MKKPVAYLACITCLVSCVNLAHAEDRARDENMQGPHHGTDGMLFRQLDTNGDGVISKAEFDAFSGKHFKTLDSNKDGKLTPDEVQGGHRHGMGQGDGATHFDRRFNAADTNHDGGLDAEEAKAMPMLSMYFAEVDANKDGKITRQEYFDAMPKLHRGKPMAPGGNSQAL